MKLFNTKRSLAIHPGSLRLNHTKFLNDWSRSKAGPKDFVIFFKGGKYLKVSFNQNSPHYKRSVPKFDRNKVFGLATKIPRDGKWQFVAYVYDNEHNLRQLTVTGETTARKALKKGILEMREYYVRINGLLLRSPEKKLEDALKSHDWWHMMSDDHRVWRAGESSMEKIKSLLDKVDDATGKELWLKYAPDQFKGYYSNNS